MCEVPNVGVQKLRTTGITFDCVSTVLLCWRSKPLPNFEFGRGRPNVVPKSAWAGDVTTTTTTTAAAAAAAPRHFGFTIHHYPLHILDVNQFFIHDESLVNCRQWTFTTPNLAFSVQTLFMLWRDVHLEFRLWIQMPKSRNNAEPADKCEIKREYADDRTTSQLNLAVNV
jgi:hypothetical protein